MDETRIEELVDRLSAFSDQCRLDAANARNERKFLMDFMLQALELANNLHNHDAALVARLKALGRKTELRASVDAWFWRPEISQGMTFRNQLRKRAGYLKVTQYKLDDAWDLLCDFVCGRTIEELDEDLLKAVFAEAYK